MAATFQLELVSPERLLLSEAVEEVILPGSEGYLTVMAGHSAMITRIIPGLVRVKMTGRPDQMFVVFDGFADITPALCSLLAESVVPIDKFDPKDIECRIARARGAFEAAVTDENRNKAEEFLYQLTTVRGVHTIV